MTQPPVPKTSKDSNQLVLNKQRKHAINLQLLRKFLLELSIHQDMHSTLSVVFISDAAMRTYNHKYRGYDKPTDVLSFRGDGDYLGDILISADTAFTQAQRSPSLTFETNLRRLVLHGFLHLSGYDHETDSGEMRAIERRLRRKFQC